jgi:hypothetical protein
MMKAAMASTRDPNDPSDDLKNAASFVPKTSRFTSFGGKPNIDKLR